MPFGFLSKPAATLQVSADKRVCLPGDAVEVTIVARSARDLAVQECFAELLCAGQYRFGAARGDVPLMMSGSALGTWAGYRAWQYVAEHRLLPAADNWLATWASRRAMGVEDAVPGQHLRLRQMLCGAALLVAGTSQTYRTSFDIPSGMPPSFEGSLAKIAWGVRAGLLPKKGKAVSSLLGLTVLSPAPAAAPMKEREGPAFANEDCSIAISMPSQALLGEKVSGTVQLMPHRDFSAASLEVLLAYSEAGAAGYHAGRTIRSEEQVELAKKLELRAREAARFPFSLTLPSAPRPSMSLPFVLNEWWVRGTLWLDDNHQYYADHPLQVYSPPTPG